MYVLHRTFGLIWQKVIYISIPLVARVKRRAASIHLPSEKAHSRKPALIHPHTYKVPERRQAGLISELPRRVLLGNSSLRWGCSRIGFFFLLVVLVAQAASGQGDHHQRHRSKAGQNYQKAVLVDDGSGKERSHGQGCNVKRPVNQDGDKEAAFRVVEDPRIDDA